MITGYLNLVLDRAERLPGFFPAFTGLLIGTDISGALHEQGWCWLFLIPGLAFFIIQPAGTSLRRYLLIRQCRRELDALNERTGMRP